MLLFLLLWIAVGALFVMVAFRDRRRPPSSPGGRVPSLPAPRHPLRQVHTALVSARQARRRAAARDAAASDAADPAEPSAETARPVGEPGRSPGDAGRPPRDADRPPAHRKPRKGSHLRKVE
jgi:hypothetical protein